MTNFRGATGTIFLDGGVVRIVCSADGNEYFDRRIRHPATAAMATE